MGRQNSPESAVEILQPSSLFHLFTINLLSLLLPLSFLLLARLASAKYLLTLLPPAAPPPPPFIISLALAVTLPLLHLLVSYVVVSTLLHFLTGKSPLPRNLTDPISQPPLFLAWILLCTLQLCVGVGIEGTLLMGLTGAAAGFSVGGGLWSRVLFFLGLYEAVVYWNRAVVKPVVDDTVFGEARRERWLEKVAMAVSFGGLWWWRLRDEAEALVVVAAAKRMMEVDLGAADFAGWWLYYITAAIGVAKIIKSLAWIVGVVICKLGSKSSYATVREVDDDFPFLLFIV